MASFASLLVPGVNIPQTDTSWLNGAADTIVGGIDKYKKNKSFNNLADLIGQQPQGAQQAAGQPQGGFLSNMAPQQQAMAAPVGAVDRSAPQGDTYQPFIDTVRTKVTNPYGLAAVAATGRAESGWSSGNANRTWSDPSQSGAPGTAGGVMSWRGPRLQAMQNFAAQKGERLGAISPQTQAEFFLQEDPNLIATLNNARSPEEAADAMARAWAFAGHDNPGQGEAARRRAMTTNYAAQFRDQPNAAASAIEAQAPGGMGSPMTDQSFDGRFGETALPGQVAQGLGGLASALTESNAAGMPQQATQPAPEVLPIQQQQQPTQVADASGGFAGIPGVQPIQRGGVPIELIQTMLRDPNLRDIGVKLWAQNVQGPNNAEPWQFVQGPDGTLLRANQQTGAIEPVGNFSKPTQADEPKIVELFDEATGQPYKARYNPSTQEYERVGGVKARSGMQLTTNPDGTVTLTEGAVGNMPKLTESEGRSTGFFGRGVESDKIISDLESQGTSLWNKTAGSVPIVGNFARSSDAQKYDQARRNFINAVLRRESGAVISPEEFANAEQQYFPQPGDGEDVIKQKADNRKTTIQGLKVSSGQGANFAFPSGQGATNGAAPVRATNPQTGQVLELRNGQWVPVQ